MSNLARSITAFGIYLLLAGLSFIFIPNLLLPLLSFPTTTEMWTWTALRRSE